MAIGYFESLCAGSHNPNISDPDWKKLELLYDTHWKDKSDGRIPKILHQVWLGSPYPEKYNILLDTWRVFHPEWEIRVWTDEDVDGFGMTNKELYDGTTNMGSKSDILRYEILYRYGGVYVDTDFLCVRSFNDFLDLDFFSGNGHVEKAEVFNGLIGCVPGNKIIGEIIRVLGEKKSNSEATYEDIMRMSGPYFFTEMVLKHCNDGKNVIFPTTYFYPYPAVDRLSIRKMEHIEMVNEVCRWRRPETYAVHLWFTSWQND